MVETAALAELKAALRVDAAARRDALAQTERSAAAQAIAGRPFPCPVRATSIVSGFMPLKSEINPLPLLRRLAQSGAQLALPVVAGRGKPLIMRSYAIGDQLASGPWGIREPMPDAPEVLPNIVIIPLLAFDRRGNRLGYGAGYFDMTLTALRSKKPIIAAGIAFAEQEVASVPTGPRDARLDLVLTQHEVIDCRTP
ncbi:MAG: 5-formyltetrahydrofolate cyclo-ligase [Xanthobacteraceae bacterium]